MISRSLTFLFISILVTACAHSQSDQNCSQRLKIAHAKHEAAVAALNEQSNRASKNTDPNEFSKTAARAADVAEINAEIAEIRKQCGIDP